MNIEHKQRTMSEWQVLVYYINIGSAWIGPKTPDEYEIEFSTKFNPKQDYIFIAA